LDEQGNITALVTQAGGVLQGDLFIDCSGFTALLINKTLGEPFISYQESLLCDRAVALPTPYW
jgi:tryptophan halogenase